MFDFEDLERLEAAPVAHPKASSRTVVRIWAISDLHTDDHHNKVGLLAAIHSVRGCWAHGFGLFWSTSGLTMSPFMRFSHGG